MLHSMMSGKAGFSYGKSNLVRAMTKRRFFRYFAVLAGISGLVVASVVPVRAEPTVSAVRLGVHADKIRVVIELSDSVSFHIFPLIAPYRLVVDLPAMNWRAKPRLDFRRTGLVSGLRYGLFSSTASRIVLDLNMPARVKKSFILPPAGGKPYRLVLDIVETSHDGMVASEQKPRRTATPVVPTAREILPGLQALGFLPGPPGRKPNFLSAHKRVIVIDPGHGGVDPGAVTRKGVFEKHVVLAAAKVFKKRLEQSGRYKVFLTRDRDVFVRLRDRIAFARSKNADLFVSLHADAIKSNKVRGMSVYTLSERASDKEAAALAEKENKSDLIAGVDLSTNSKEVTDILIDLAQRESMNESSRFASVLVGKLSGVGRLLPNSHRFAGFAVLKAPDVPSVLVELGFLSNQSDARALLSGTHRTKVADALYRAVDEYFNPVEQVGQN